MATEKAVFVALLEPWWRVFPPQYLGFTISRPDVEPREVLVTLSLTPCPPGDEAESTWRRYCEAIDILFLAALVQPLEFQEMMWGNCRARGQPSERFNRNDDVSWQLLVHLYGRPPSPKTWWERLWGTRSTWHLDVPKMLLSPPPIRSEMFEATRAALLAMSGQKKEEFEKRAIPVTLSVDFYDELDIVSTLEHVVELHHRYLTGIDQDQRGLYPLAVNKLKVDIKHWMGSAVLVDVVERCNTTRGLQLDRIAIGPTTRLVVHSDIRSLIWRWATMFTGLPVNRSVCASNQAHVQLSGSKQLDLWLASNVTTAAFLSGVMYSNGVRELILRRSLTVHPSVSEFRWFWLFYSLFNAEATHELTSLSIDDDTIRLADMVKVREFVCSPRPLELLLDSRYDESFAEAARLPSSSTRPAQVVLRRHAPIHLDPTQRLKPLTVDAEDTKFDVMHSLADSYDILVPGYGQCWVNFDDVVAEIPLCQENERCRWKLKTHSITKLSINLADLESDADDRGLPLLLELIGSPITHLSLGFDSDNLRDQSILDAALTHCPSLVSLSLYRVQFDSLDHVFEAYANGQCRVSDLSLDFLALHQPSSIFQLVNLLADPTTTMANTLRQLSLTLDGETPITNEMLEAFAVMLKTNERLRFLTLSVSADQLSRFPPIFSCFNGQHVRSGLPLSARCKRAFLSVVKHAQDIPDVDDSDDAITLSRAVGQLDSLVLTTIFRLAGNVEVRSIVLKAFR